MIRDTVSRLNRFVNKLFVLCASSSIAARCRTGPAEPPQTKARLQLQSLEARDVPAVYTVGGAAGDYASLALAVAAANAAGGANTVNFDFNNNGGAENLTSQIVLTSNITIDGTDAPAIKAAAGNRIFVVASNTATIQNFAAGTLTPNGLITDDGGIIWVQGAGSLTLTTVTLNGGQAKDGGAVEFDGNKLLVSGSTFTADSAVNNNGGAININGGAGAGNVVITNSTFGSLTNNALANSASRNGGAIAAYGSSPLTTTVQLLSDTFGNNTAGGDGGAVATTDNLSVGVTGAGGANQASTFGNNTTNPTLSGWGGAIYWAPASSGSESLSVNATSFTSNSAQQGGAIYANVNVSLGTQTESITQSTFIKNASTGNGKSGYGGAVAIVNVTTNTASAAATLTNDTFNGNTAQSHGGAVAVSPSNQGSTGNNTASLTSLTITGNTSANDGGGVWIGGGAVNFDNDILDGNTSQGVPTGPQNLALGAGGSVGTDQFNLVATSDKSIIGRGQGDQVDLNNIPGLGALAVNGPANYPRTQVVLKASKAYLVGDPALLTQVDENGVVRTPANNNIGAVANN